MDSFLRSEGAADLSCEHEHSARERMISRDEADWPIVATSLLLRRPVWTQDRDFFRSGIPTWTSETVEHYFRTL
ncbi:PIN domain-containing protein [Silvibacterium acidisoli]|uniref:PIN domain-containing protein n=1 Tax=Acidobacteriaceae bacterium ZG23-2 TaxID=2883246 RepID=UPI00406C663C